MSYLVISRLLFGLGGSKVVHRKYIANFVPRTMWNKYYSRLILTSFIGMCTGPLIYLFMVYLSMQYSDIPLAFLTPGYIGLLLFACLFLITIIFFRRYAQKKEQPRMRTFGINTTSYQSLYSGDDKKDEEA